MKRFILLIMVLSVVVGLFCFSTVNATTPFPTPFVENFVGNSTVVLARLISEGWEFDDEFFIFGSNQFYGLTFNFEEDEDDQVSITTPYIQADSEYISVSFSYRYSYSYFNDGIEITASIVGKSGNIYHRFVTDPEIMVVELTHIYLGEIGEPFRIKWIIDYNFTIWPNALFILGNITIDNCTPEDPGELAISFSSFNARVVEFINTPIVRLDWATDSENGIQGFHILRNFQASKISITPNMIPATNTAFPTRYDFIDNQIYIDGDNLNQIELLYWIEIRFSDGTTDLHGPIQVSIEREETPGLTLFTALHSVYPNPVVDTANFEFRIKTGETATLQIFNIRGQMIREYRNLSDGHSKISWDRRCTMGREVSSGVYFYRLSNQNYSSMRRMVIVR